MTTPAEVADGERDGLAFLAAALRDDYEGMGVIVTACDILGLIAFLASALFAELAAHGEDPAQWVAEAQARATGELGL